MTEKGKNTKRKFSFRKVLKYILLLIVLTGAGLFFFAKDRDIATGAIEKAILKSLDSAGFEGSVEEISGNPFKGYRITGIQVLSTDILQTSIETVTIELDLPGVFRWKPVKRINISNSEIVVQNLEKLGSLKPEPSESKFSMPPIPVEIDALKLEIENHVLTIEKGGIYASTPVTSLDLKGSADGMPWTMQSSIETGDQVTLPRFLLDLGPKGNITISGDISPEMDIDGQIKELDLSALGMLDRRLEGITGNFTSDLHFTGSVSDPAGNGNFNLSQGSVNKTSLGELSGKWTLEKGLFRIDPVLNRILGTTLEGQFSIATGGEMQVRVEGKDLDLGKAAELNIQTPEMEGKVETFNLVLSGKPPLLEGELKLASSGFSVSGHSISSLNLDVLLKEKVLQTDSSFFWKGTKTSAKGTVELADSGKVNFNVNVPIIDLAILPDIISPLANTELEGSASMTMNVKGYTKDPVIEGSLSSSRFSIRKEGFENTAVALRIEKGDLVIKRLSSNGLGGTVSGSGTINSLYNKPVLNIGINANDMDLERITKLLPSPPEDLEGSVNMDVQVTGPASSPVVKANIRGRMISMGDLAQAETIEAKASIKGKEAPVVEISSPLATAAGIILQKLKASLSWKAPDLMVRNMETTVLGGGFSGSGVVRTSPSPSLDLKVRFRDLDLKDLPFQGLPSIDGIVEGDLQIEGTPADPKLGLKARSSQIRSGCVSLNNIDLQGSITKKKVDITSLGARVGNGLLKGGMSLIPLEKRTDVYFNLVGSQLDLAALLPPEEECPVNISGTMDLQLQGDLLGNQLNSEGTLTSENISVQGLTIESIHIPLDITANKANIRGMKAQSFGGTVSGDLDLDLDGMEWKTTLKAESIDITEATREIPQLIDKFTGTAFLDVTFKGKGFNPYTLFGFGLVDVKNGDIGGIPAVRAAAATAGQERVKFKRARSNFLADGFGITILGGSRVEAPRKYPLYKRIEIDGNIQYDGDLDLKGSADVNIQALNAFMGTLEIALKTALSQGDLVQDLLGGLKGIGKKDFRTVNFEIAGNRSAPEIKKLEIQGGQEYLRELLQMEEDDRERTGTDDRQISIKLQFPVGPGGESDEDDAGEQLQEQVLEGILKNLFPTD